jgi:hypothetical protein
MTLMINTPNRLASSDGAASISFDSFLRISGSLEGEQARIAPANDPVIGKLPF